MPGYGQGISLGEFGLRPGPLLAKVAEVRGSAVCAKRKTVERDPQQEESDERGANSEVGEGKTTREARSNRRGDSGRGYESHQPWR